MLCVIVYVVGGRGRGVLDAGGAGVSKYDTGGWMGGEPSRSLGGNFPVLRLKGCHAWDSWLPCSSHPSARALPSDHVKQWRRSRPERDRPSLPRETVSKRAKEESVATRACQRRLYEFRVLNNCRLRARALALLVRLTRSLWLKY